MRLSKKRQDCRRLNCLRRREWVRSTCGIVAEHSYAFKTIRSPMTNNQDMPDAHQAVLDVVRTCQMRIRQCQLVIPDIYNALNEILSLPTNFVGAQPLVK